MVKTEPGERVPEKVTTKPGENVPKMVKTELHTVTTTEQGITMTSSKWKNRNMSIRKRRQKLYQQNADIVRLSLEEMRQFEQELCSDGNLHLGAQENASMGEQLLEVESQLNQTNTSDGGLSLAMNKQLKQEVTRVGELSSEVQENIDVGGQPFESQFKLENSDGWLSFEVPNQLIQENTAVGVLSLEASLEVNSQLKQENTSVEELSLEVNGQLNRDTSDRELSLKVNSQLNQKNSNRKNRNARKLSSEVKRKLKWKTCSVGGLSFEAQKLLMNKFVMIIGDSNQRSVYKDLVLLLQDNKYLTESEMKRKGEKTFLNDRLLAGGILTNSIGYREEREYRTECHRVNFYFVTRCYNKYIEFILNQFSGDSAPDLIIMNSCLWDLTRYAPEPLIQYRNRMGMLCCQLVKKMRLDTQIVWTTTPPISKKPRGGFLSPHSESESRMLSQDVMRANYEASNIAIDHGFFVLDLHFWLRNKLNLRTSDGVHWCSIAHRYISELLLSSMSYLWGIPFSYISPMSRQPYTCIARDTEPAELKPLMACVQHLEQVNPTVQHNKLAPFWQRPAPYNVPERHPQHSLFRYQPFNSAADFGMNHRPVYMADGFGQYGGSLMNSCRPLEDSFTACSRAQDCNGNIAHSQSNWSGYAPTSPDWSSCASTWSNWSVPREFFDTWSDYTSDSFEGPQRHPHIAGRLGFRGY